MNVFFCGVLHIVRSNLMVNAVATCRMLKIKLSYSNFLLSRHVLLSVRAFSGGIRYYINLRETNAIAFPESTELKAELFNTFTKKL